MEWGSNFIKIQYFPVNLHNMPQVLKTFLASLARHIKFWQVITINYIFLEGIFVQLFYGNRQKIDPSGLCALNGTECPNGVFSLFCIGYFSPRRSCPKALKFCIFVSEGVFLGF